MSLKFCANLSFMFQETGNLLERYELAKHAGFKAVEYAFPYNFPVDKVVEAKNKSNLKQILINAYPGDTSKGDRGLAAVPGREEDFKQSIEKAVEYASALDCKRIHIMSGVLEQENENHFELYQRNLETAVKILEKADIVGLIEPINNYSVPNYFLNSYEKGLRAVKRIQSPHLKLQLDIFHLQHICGNITNNIEKLLPYVGHIQVAQVPNRNEPDTEGEIDYKYVFSVLEKLGYNGWIGLEYTPKNKTTNGLKWIENFGFKL